MKNICIVFAFILVLFNIKVSIAQNNFSKKMSLGVTAQFCYGSYHTPLFIELNDKSIGKEYTLGMLIKYDISKKIDVETGVLLTMQEGKDFRIYWRDMHRYFDFDCYSDNLLYTKIPIIAKFYPFDNDNNIYPLLYFGFQTGILLGGIRTIYSYSENDASGNVFNVKDREFFSILYNYNIYPSYKYNVYTNLILGGGVYINPKKLNIYCGINFPIGLINSQYSQFSLQSISFVTAIYF